MDMTPEQTGAALALFGGRRAKAPCDVLFEGTFVDR